MHGDVASIAKQQKEIGYDSAFIEGAKDSADYMKSIFHDWQAKGITSVLHEKRGGYANNTKSVYGLATKAEAQNVRIMTGIQVTGFKRASASSAVTAVETNRGTIHCEYVVVAAGPWVKSLWEMLALPRTISIRGRDGKHYDDIPMWTYWCLQEGVLGVDPDFQKTNDGKMPPVIHVDTDAPLFSDVDDSLITDRLWGIYYKPDFSFGGIQGGSMPYRIETDPDDVRVDPYGPESPDYVVGEDFAHMWCSALAHCQKRFEGKIGVLQERAVGRHRRVHAGQFSCF